LDSLDIRMLGKAL